MQTMHGRVWADRHNTAIRCTTDMKTKKIPWGWLFKQNSISRQVVALPDVPNLMPIKFKAPTNILGKKIWFMALISSVYPVLLWGKEIWEKIIVQHLGSQMLICSQCLTLSVIIGVLERGQWMEAAPFIPFHQPALCPMLLWFFCQQVGEGHFSLVTSVHCV